MQTVSKSVRMVSILAVAFLTLPTARSRATDTPCCPETTATSIRTELSMTWVFLPGDCSVDSAPGTVSTANFVYALVSSYCLGECCDPPDAAFDGGSDGDSANRLVRQIEASSAAGGEAAGGELFSPPELSSLSHAYAHVEFGGMSSYLQSHIVIASANIGIEPNGDCHDDGNWQLLGLGIASAASDLAWNLTCPTTGPYVGPSIQFGINYGAGLSGYGSEISCMELLQCNRGGSGPLPASMPTVLHARLLRIDVLDGSSSQLLCGFAGVHAVMSDNSQVRIGVFADEPFDDLDDLEEGIGSDVLLSDIELPCSPTSGTVETMTVSSYTEAIGKLDGRVSGITNLNRPMLWTDRVAFEMAFGSSYTSKEYQLRADMDIDGDVDAFDYNLFHAIFVADCTCLGDVNADGTVDLLDLLEFNSGWTSQALWADINGDSSTDLLDLLEYNTIWTNTLSTTCP